MNREDQEMLTKLIFSHKHLWIRYLVMKHLREFPQDDPEAVNARFAGAAEDVYQPLTDTLLEGQPLQDVLQTVLTVVDISLAEGNQK